MNSEYHFCPYCGKEIETSTLSALVAKIREKRRFDAQRWESMDERVCQLCGMEGNDRRTLLISCLCDLSEISDVFIDLFDVKEEFKGFYGVRICKSCRAKLLDKLKEWIEESRNKWQLKFL